MRSSQVRALHGLRRSSTPVSRAPLHAGTPCFTPRCVRVPLLYVPALALQECLMLATESRARASSSGRPLSPVQPAHGPPRRPQLDACPRISGLCATPRCPRRTRTVRPEALSPCPSLSSLACAPPLPAHSPRTLRGGSGCTPVPGSSARWPALLPLLSLHAPRSAFSVPR